MVTLESVGNSYTGTSLPFYLVEEADKSRDRLRSALLMNHHTLEVDLKDLIAWNDELAQKVQEHPGEMVPLVS
jgi:DNA replication licensing factor MCM5